MRLTDVKQLNMKITRSYALFYIQSLNTKGLIFVKCVYAQSRINIAAFCHLMLPILASLLIRGGIVGFAHALFPYRSRIKQARIKKGIISANAGNEKKRRLAPAFHYLSLVYQLLAIT
jgi:hypothetical protein